MKMQPVFYSLEWAQFYHFVLFTVDMLEFWSCLWTPFFITFFLQHVGLSKLLRLRYVQYVQFLPLYLYSTAGVSVLTMFKFVVRMKTHRSFQKLLQERDHPCNIYH